MLNMFQDVKSLIDNKSIKSNTSRMNVYHRKHCKYLTKRIASDKVLYDKVFEDASNTDYDEY